MLMHEFYGSVERGQGNKARHTPKETILRCISDLLVVIFFSYDSSLQ